jgi:DNA-binding SARP family transcriptional activator/tetratricopeptide (TPR) repeat protein
MEFRILGPLEVRESGRIVPVRRRKQRALLASLLLHAGAAVSVDQLIDDLWGERPPPSAKHSLQNTVSALRKVLGEAVVRTRSPGYLLEVERESVDLFRFERLVEEARGADGAKERVECLRQALALWRGPPLADLAFEPFVLLEAPRLEELRMAAREELIETRLGIGEDGELVPELEALVADHPFNERLRGQLMTALYRSGRQADALELYREGRRLLVVELGLEPSTPLRELEQAILRQDAALAVAPSKPSPLLPLRKTATVVFADLVAAARAVQELDPEVLARVLTSYATAAQRALERHRGTTDVLRSGALLAVFGVPTAHEDDALRALRAAAELRDELRALGGELEPRIGIGTGEVFVGGPASTALVTGAVVDIAKRLEEAAAPGEILIGAGTVRLVREAAKLVPLEPLRVGEAPPLGAWQLTDLIEGAPAIPRRFDAPLVGRRRELAELRRAFETARTEARCRLLVLAGEPGIGKTRLMREFAASVAEEATVLVGRCVSYGQGATWLPLLEIARAADADTAEDLSSLLSAEQDGALVARRVAAAFGLEEEPASLEETNWAVRRLFEVLALRAPLVLVFEDIHWAEPTLLDLIGYLGERTAAPILVLCLTRPELLETRLAWTERALTLTPLPEADMGTLVDALQADLDSGARARVVEISEGNPLFAEQLAVHAQQQGAHSLELPPPSIEALLASRIDLLPTAERAILQVAAVIGRRFSRAVLLELLAAADQAMTGLQLRMLFEKRFIRSGAIEDYLSFQHVLVRSVAYSGIPKAVRADLHERVADLLARRDTPDEVVGYHLEQSYRYGSELAPADGHAIELGRKAAARLASAAERAVVGEDMRAAAALFARAADLLPRHEPPRPQLLAALGEALGWVAEAAQASAVLEEAIEGARAVGDARLEWSARLEQSFARRQTDAQAWADRTRREVEQAIEECERLEHDEGLMKAWRLLGILERDCGHHAAGEQALKHALAYASRHEDARMERLILGVLAQIAVSGPTPTVDAIRLVEGQLEFARTRGYPQWEAECNERLAVLWAMRHEFDKAWRMLADSRALRESRLGWESGIELRSRAHVATLAGDLAAAEPAYRAAQRSFAGRGNVWMAAAVAVELAHILVAQSRDPEALRITEQSVNELPAWDVAGQTLWRQARAKVLANSGALDEAERLARDAVELASTTDDLLLNANALVDLADVLRLAGDEDGAIHALERALLLYERKGNIVGAERARDSLDHPVMGPSKSVPVTRPS